MALQRPAQLVSVIIPVGAKGIAAIERSIRSLQCQSHAGWELLAVDYASPDGRNECLEAWIGRDPRIHLGIIDRNRCPAAARNAALRRARGEFIAYLDPGDEYYPNHLAEVVAAGQESDVLLFAFDISYENGPADGRATAWEPGRAIDRLFAENIAAPLGVAHRRSILERVGGFNELLWRGEDWDFWKRLARAGLRFRVLPSKSGRHSAAADGANQERTPTPWQLAMLKANREAGRPIFCARSSVIEARRASEVMRNQNSLARRASMAVTQVAERQVGKVPHVRAPASRRKVESIAFVSPHCLLDDSNGAAISTRETLQFLESLGFHCQAFCGSRLDVKPPAAASDTNLKRQRGNEHAPSPPAPLPSTGEGRMVPVTIFDAALPRNAPASGPEAQAFLRACEAFLKNNRPDAVLSYGGDPLALAAMAVAKRLDIPVLFSLRNFSYHVPGTFASADYVLVPSEFSRCYYWNEMGLACHYIPQVVDWGRVLCPHPKPLPEGEGTAGLKSEIPNSKSETNPEIRNLKFENGGPHPNPLPEGEGTRSPQPLAEREGTISPRCVTLVNPEANKGIFVFARIAERLAELRPDIPLLVVEARGRWGDLEALGIDIGKLKNVTVMPNTPDPRAFYAMTRLLVMPSLWNESFGRAAAEAMLNGIPVLASNRGALPETVGDAGFLFDVPARYTPESREVPTVGDVAPWVEAIIRLWDDAAEYERWSRAARERARQWHPDRLAPVYREFFGGVTHQPGPPLVPREQGARGRG